MTTPPMDILGCPTEVLPAAASDEIIDRVAATIAGLERVARLQLALAIGQAIVEGIYQGDLEAWRGRGRKDSSIRKLAERPGMPSRATLQRAASIYDLQQRTGGSTWSHLGVSHVRAVLGLPADDQCQLLAAAESEHWTVKHIETEAGKKRKRDGRGRKPDPAFVKAIAKLDKIVGDEGALYGDLDRLDRLDHAQVTALYRTVDSVKLACERLQEHLAAHAEPRSSE